MVRWGISGEWNIVAYIPLYMNRDDIKHGHSEKSHTHTHIYIYVYIVIVPFPLMCSKCIQCTRVAVWMQISRLSWVVKMVNRNINVKCNVPFLKDRIISPTYFECISFIPPADSFDSESEFGCFMGIEGLQFCSVISTELQRISGVIDDPCATNVQI